MIVDDCARFIDFIEKVPELMDLEIKKEVADLSDRVIKKEVVKLVGNGIKKELPEFTDAEIKVEYPPVDNLGGAVDSRNQEEIINLLNKCDRSQLPQVCTAIFQNCSEEIFQTLGDIFFDFQLGLLIDKFGFDNSLAESIKEERELSSFLARLRHCTDTILDQMFASYLDSVARPADVVSVSSDEERGNKLIGNTSRKRPRSSKKGKPQKCSKCGQLRRGHRCPVAQTN